VNISKIAISEVDISKVVISEVDISEVAISEVNISVILETFTYAYLDQAGVLPHNGIGIPGMRTCAVPPRVYVAPNQPGLTCQ
jgi:hypothetical protein